MREAAGGAVRSPRPGSPPKLAYSSFENQPAGLYQGFFWNGGFGVCTAVDGTTSVFDLVCLIVLAEPFGHSAVGAGWSDGGGRARVGSIKRGGRTRYGGL